MSDQPNTPTTEEPEILVQNPEELPKVPPDSDAENSAQCRRCGASIPREKEYCDACSEHMTHYPIGSGAVIGAVLLGLVTVFSIFVLGVNLLIARQVHMGDKALAAGDYRTCYTAYANSYNVAERLNALLVPSVRQKCFTNGSNTLSKQIKAMAALNGPYQAGQVIDSIFAGNPPASLQGIYDEYRNITLFVDEMQSAVSKYKDSLEPGDSGNYEDMVALVDAAAKKLPRTPDYMVEYYRFSVSYSLNDDPNRTCTHLENLVKMAPDSLWLYASEGIRAYNQIGEYNKALKLCNKLMQNNAGEPSAIAYTMAELRLLKKFDEALVVYNNTLTLTAPSSEMERQRAIILMLQGDSKSAQEILVSSYSPSTATLEHVATIAVCAHINGDMKTYSQYKTMLDSYMPFEQVDLFAAGEMTLEDIFLKDGGEIR